uniref:hypothetical protein n=1 Tax=Azospirillum argentinense TaxID=2970906 RepID=UPI0010C03F4C|nr:hypothetical protein [Azospirillum argentinense]
MIAYLHPFRLVQTDGQAPWHVTIEQINHRGWDYAALHEIAGGIDIGLQPPYHLVVGRDGALALPPIDDLRSTQAAVEFINRCLAGLLLGGIYCEAINPDALDVGSIIDWAYIRVHKSGPAAANRFHKHVRHLQAAPLEAIALVQPRQIGLDELRTAMGAGLKILNAVPLMRGEYLLKGTTGLARLDWGSALANLWIVVEQLVADLWERKVVEPTLETDPSKSRRSQLMDTRSWTASARIEMLFQKALIDLDTVHALGKARRARNSLHHSGQHPSSDDAWAAYQGIAGLLMVALDGERPSLFDLDLADHALIDPFTPPKPLLGEPTHWMAIPKLPGEEQLERAETEVFRAG